MREAPITLTGSVRRKLTWVTAVSSMSALLLACGAFLLYEYVTFRDGMVRNLSTHAQIIATNSSSALVFDDPRAASETLGALRAEPHIMAVQIRASDGRELARYVRDNVQVIPPLPDLDLDAPRGHRFVGDRLVVYERILSDGQPIGAVFIQSDLEEMSARIFRYLGIALIVLLTSLGVGSLAAARMQRRISQPILNLARTARQVSSEKTYALRVAVESEDEIGLLAQSFNGMLEQIEEHNTQLRRAHDTLEKRVEERTEELREEIVEREQLEEELRTKNIELEKQYRRAQEATRLKSEFLANMSHELRTPLNAIMGFSEVLYDERLGQLAEIQKEYLGDILASSRHLLHLINDVLDLSKVEAGKMEFRPEQVDLERLLGETRDVLRSLAANKRIRIDVTIDPSVHGVFVDPSKLKQVLYNYLSNAIKFTPDGGSISVRALPEGDDAFRIEVEDTGIGIREQDMERLFVEFQQLDAQVAKKHPGTGLGLALTKRIVEAQGGRYGARSTYGKGSTFFAVLPRSARPAARVSAGPVPQNGALEGAPRVLVIEDEARERAWLMGVLEGAGYVVDTAATGAEAIERVRQKRYDEITLDLLLPDMSGWDVLRAIRREDLNRNAEIIVVTVVAEKGLAARFAVHDFLVKPVRAEDLLDSLKKARSWQDAGGPIVVVDPDPDALKYMEVALAQIGYSTVCRATAESGLRAIAEANPWAAVIGVGMPGREARVDTLELLARLRRTETGARLPVVVWADRAPTPEEQGRLSALAQSVVLKDEAGPKRIVVELESLLRDRTHPAGKSPKDHGGGGEHDGSEQVDDR